MQPYLFDVLADPETHGPLSRAGDDDLAKLRTAIAERRARRRDGHAVPSFEGAFLTTDRKAAYLVEDGVPNFVIDERVELDSAL
ncbi:hypothetical protein [Sandaracinus amylolyticus]|uniref:Uncharacterized protein n=1 Tax=Sandaracinus amylolyticus TaxID=927083 RepID=A0A0F6SFQ3_9BACT|nr:hypothetical protein [Sandaracinus amylolyticus]AKF07344.1 hypothetical protein DB32_004493 [Sandaracinus amylolyticus]